MAIEIKHPDIAPLTAPAKISSTEWNKDHLLTMATARLIGRTTAGAGAAEEISVGSGLSLSGGSLAAAAGAVLQVVQATTTTEVVIASTAMTDTGLSATITPSATSSKILVLVSQGFYVQRNTSSAYGGIELRRGSTTIHNALRDTGGGGYDFGIFAANSGATYLSLSSRADIKYLDSPNTTSAVTYSTRGAADDTANSGEIVFQATGTATTAPSTIILMEIKG